MNRTITAQHSALEAAAARPCTIATVGTVPRGRGLTDMTDTDSTGTSRRQEHST